MKPPLLHHAAFPKAAFSLIEIALSIAIIAIGLVAILGVMPSLLTSSRGAVENTEIAMAAQNSVDMDFAAWRTPDDLNLRYRPGDSPLGDNVKELYVGSSLKASNYISYVTATNILANKEFKELNGAAAGNPLLRTVLYTYTWPPGSTRPQTFTFVTEICATTNIVMQ
jgi:type II secretory pathway pseudopilin PulG